MFRLVRSLGARLLLLAAIVYFVLTFLIALLLRYIWDGWIVSLAISSVVVFLLFFAIYLVFLGSGKVHKNQNLDTRDAGVAFGLGRVFEIFGEQLFALVITGMVLWFAAMYVDGRTRDAYIQSDFRDRLLGYDLEGSDLQGVKIFAGSDLRNQSLRLLSLKNLDVSGSMLQSSSWRGSDLICFDFTNVDGGRADFLGANMTKSILRNADLVGADFSSADLNHTDFSSAKLEGATFEGANLRYAHLNGVSFKDVNLSGADLTGAELVGADFRDADLTEADLSRAKISGARFDRNESIKEVRGWDGVYWRPENPPVGLEEVEFSAEKEAVPDSIPDCELPEADKSEDEELEPAGPEVEESDENGTD